MNDYKAVKGLILYKNKYLILEKENTCFSLKNGASFCFTK